MALNGSKMASPWRFMWNTEQRGSNPFKDTGSHTVSFTPYKILTLTEPSFGESERKNLGRKRMDYNPLVH
jgi:hypothetical protein